MIVFSGLSDNVKTKKSNFQPTTWKIIEFFGEIWYITKCYSNINIDGSYYDAVLAKPTDEFQNKFNLDKEIIVIFSNYPRWFPKTLDVIDHIKSNDKVNRFEEICSIVVSNYDSIDDAIRSNAKDNKESQIIIPFSYKELDKNYQNHNYVINKFRKFFFSRDLFGISSALQKEIYFFGRKDLVHTLVSNYIDGENSGVFGLRKTGKTSILYSVKRSVISRNGIVVWIDCQDTSIYLKRWNQLLYVIINEIYSIVQMPLNSNVNDYTVEKASDLFEKDLLSIYSTFINRKILIIFDEVEQITFDISESENWKSGKDFIAFWRTIRAKFQKHLGVFSYIISSTNPKSVEKPYINGTDNPVFSHVNEYYIDQFSLWETREMISVLGGYMGLKFEDDLFGFINRDYGGHPLLIRHVCSEIHSMAGSTRPRQIIRIDYEKAKKKFENEKSKGFYYAEMILEVLERFYPDELTMLISLATGDEEFFYEYASESPEYTSHLLGYGIITKNDNDEYDFKIDLIKRFLINKEARKEKFQSLLNNSNNTQGQIRKNKANSKIFISYAHADREFFDRLMVHLTPLIREEYIDVWTDDRIKPGDNWSNEIELALKQSNIAILLITADFMASKYISEVELPSLLSAAHERGAIIIPVFIKTTNLNRFTNISQYQGANSPDQPFISLNDHQREKLLADLSSEIDELFNKK